MTSISVTTEPVSEPELPSLGGLTPDGNLALIDDILDGSYYSSEGDRRGRQDAVRDR